MRRLTRVFPLAAVLACLVQSGCKPRDPVRLQPTDESAPELTSVVHMADPKAAIQLMKGFHSVEHNAWRWTMGQFSVTLKVPPGGAQKGAALVGTFTLPDAVISKVKSTTLSASIGGAQVGSASYKTAGEHTFSADVPAAVLKPEAVTIDFALSSFLPAGSVDVRELGLVASTIALNAK